MKPVALLLVLCACRTQPLQPPRHAGSGAPGPACKMQPVPLQLLQVDDLNLCPLDLVRVTYAFTIYMCQPYLEPSVDYDAGSNTFTLTELACPPTCSGLAMMVEYTAILSETAAPQPGVLTVRDGAPGSSTSLVLPIQKEVTPGECGTVTQGSCTSNSVCEAVDPASRCWYDGGKCVHVCYDDSDCHNGVHCDRGFCL